MSATLLLTWGATGILTPFGGALGDRFDRRTVMIVSDLAAGTAIACLALTSNAGDHAGDRPRIGGRPGAVLLRVDGRRAEPGRGRGDRMGQRDGGRWAETPARRLLGLVLGGVLVGIADPSVVFLLNAACFAASAALGALGPRPVLRPRGGRLRRAPRRSGRVPVPARRSRAPHDHARVGRPAGRRWPGAGGGAPAHAELRRRLGRLRPARGARGARARSPGRSWANASARAASARS